MTRMWWNCWSHFAEMTILIPAVFLPVSKGAFMLLRQGYYPTTVGQSPQIVKARCKKRECKEHCDRTDSNVFWVLHQYHGWLKSTDDYIKICAVMLLSGSLTIIKLAKKRKEVVGIKCSPLKMDDHVIGLRYQMTALHNYCRSKHQHNNIQPHTSQHSYPSAA